MASTVSSSTPPHPPPSKRPRLTTDTTNTTTDVPAMKQRKLAPIARQKVDLGVAEILPEEVVGVMLEQSIGLILQSHGFDNASKMALEHIRELAEDFMLSLTQQAMLYSQTQRRSRPTIIDCAESLKRSHISISSLEDEITRYRKSLPKSRKKPVTYHIGPPLPSTAPISEDFLSELLGPELIEPRTQIKVTVKPSATVWQQFAEIHKPPMSPTTPNVNLRPPIHKTSTITTERPYIEVHHPQLPSKHTYQRTEVLAFDRTKEQREIREQATEEARMAGETLRKLLAQFSKVKMKGAIEEPPSTTGAGSLVRRGVAPGGSKIVSLGDKRKQARDSAWQQVWSEISSATITNSALNGDNQKDTGLILTNGVGALELSADPEARKTDAETKGWMDVIVNSEKDLWRKGTMTRSLRKDFVKA